MNQECSHFFLRRGTWVVTLIALLVAPTGRGPAVVLAQPSSEHLEVAPRSPEALRAILANQPDFAAAVSGCNVKRPTGDPTVGRLSRSGSTYRIEMSPSVFGRGPEGTISMGQIAWLLVLGTGEDDMSVATALVPDRKGYFTHGEGFEDALFLAVIASPYMSFLSPEWLDGECGLRDAGPDVVNGVRCLKIEAATRSGEVIVFYAAGELDNLVVRIVVRESRSLGMGGPFQSLDFEGAVIDLVDVQLHPPRSLFEVPSGFHLIEAPELYLDEGGGSGDRIPAKRAACPEPSKSGEVSRKELCPPKEPENKGPTCAGFTVERSSLRSGETCKLEAHVLDPDGDPLQYVWSTTGGHIVNVTISRCTFDATGLAPGKYVVTVMAYDGHDHTVECATTIEVVPND